MIPDPMVLVVVATALFLGGLLKGATGAGTPVVAVPVIAAFADVHLAVLVMVVPNLVSNLWQVATYRADIPEDGFTRRFALGGVAGVMLGTAVFVALPTQALQVVLAAVVLLYIGLRLTRPDLRLAPGALRRAAFPVGLTGGALQGAAGISAPVTISFLNAARLPRRAFVAVISVFFLSITAVQFAALELAREMTGPILALGVISCLPMLAGMPVGELLARRVSDRTFDRVILLFLAALAARLIWTSLP